MLKSISFFNQITIWWDIFEFNSKVDKYSILVDGVSSFVTTKTHFTLNNLNPSTEYKIIIKGFFGKNFVDEKSLSIYTKKAKTPIDVTCQPYCAVGDGKRLNTAAIQRAIDDCREDEYVYFPSGIFLTGALELKDNLELYVDSGATIQGSADVNDYLPQKRSRFEGIERNCYRSLLNLGKLDNKGGYTSGNLVIRGQGKILGGGRELFCATLDKPSVVYDENGPHTPEAVDAWRSRGRLIEVCNAENVVVCGLTVGMSSSWNLHFVYSKNITTFGCKIISHGINNGDGWDPDSCSDCAIFDCEFHTGDDLVAIKSGKNPEGNIINIPCENIYIFDCKSIGGHGMSIGSEISGGIKGVYVWDCDFSDSWYGFQIKATKKRGAYVKDVYVSNCKLSCVLIWAVGYNDDGDSSVKTPVFENFNFKNIVVTGTDYFIKVKTSTDIRYIYLEGFGQTEPIRKINFDGVTLLVRDGNCPKIETKHVENVVFDNVTRK